MSQTVQKAIHNSSIIILTISIAVILSLGIRVFMKGDISMQTIIIGAEYIGLAILAHLIVK